MALAYFLRREDAEAAVAEFHGMGSFYHLFEATSWGYFTDEK